MSAEEAFAQIKQRLGVSEEEAAGLIMAAFPKAYGHAFVTATAAATANAPASAVATSASSAGSGLAIPGPVQGRAGGNAKKDRLAGKRMGGINEDYKDAEYKENEEPVANPTATARRVATRAQIKATAERATASTAGTVASANVVSAAPTPATLPNPGGSTESFPCSKNRGRRCPASQFRARRVDGLRYQSCDLHRCVGAWAKVRK